MPAEVMPWAIIWNMAPFMPHDQYVRVRPRRPDGDAQDDVAHVADRAVGHQLLEVGLGHGREGAVDDVDDAEQGHPAGQLLGRPRTDRIGDADDAVAAQLQQHAGQDHADRRRRLDVGVGQPGVEREHRHLDGEADEQEQEHRVLEAGREERLRQGVRSGLRAVRRFLGRLDVGLGRGHGSCRLHRSSASGPSPLAGACRSSLRAQIAWPSSSSGRLVDVLDVWPLQVLQRGLAGTRQGTRSKELTCTCWSPGLGRRSGCRGACVRSALRPRRRLTKSRTSVK